MDTSEIPVTHSEPDRRHDAEQEQEWIAKYRQALVSAQEVELHPRARVRRVVTLACGFLASKYIGMRKLWQHFRRSTAATAKRPPQPSSPPTPPIDFGMTETRVDLTQKIS